MNFRARLAIRNRTFEILCACCGLTMTLLVYGFIKWQKVIYYHPRMYQNLNPYDFEHFKFLLNKYFLVFDFKIIYLIFITIIIDFVIISKIKASKLGSN